MDRRRALAAGAMPAAGGSADLASRYGRERLQRGDGLAMDKTLTVDAGAGVYQCRVVSAGAGAYPPGFSTG